MNHLLQPKKYKSLMADPGSRAIMDQTIDFFENRMGKSKLTEDYWSRVWYREFLNNTPITRTAGGIRLETVNTASCFPFTDSGTGIASR